MQTICHVEIFVAGRWHRAATFELLGAVEDGMQAPGRLEYLPEYTIEHLEDPAWALSCAMPVDFRWHAPRDGWPAFLLDLIPSGAARRDWEDRLGLPNGPSGDWQLLLFGAGNPVGNLRIIEAVQVLPEQSHPGFSRQEVIDRSEGFIEYAQQHGAPVAGSTGAQGDAPKFLLAEDRNGRWHADGALPDAQVARHWLVKFPRGREERDRLILEAEAGYMAVARELGLRVATLPTHEDGTLFIPRFDRRVTEAGVERLGLETLCSLAGINRFGVSVPQEVLVDALVQFSADPTGDVVEFLCRDALNLALGNTDNHGRNSAVLKQPDGTAMLSPLYDFAPMFLDRQGIARVCRWRNESGWPDWGAILDDLGTAHATLDCETIGHRLRAFGERLGGCADWMADCGVPPEVTETRRQAIDAVADGLIHLAPPQGPQQG